MNLKCKNCWAVHTPGTNKVCDCLCHKPTSPQKEPQGWDWEDLKEAMRGMLKFPDEITGDNWAKFTSNLVKEAKRRGEERGRRWNILWNEHLRQINLVKAQARTEAFEEVEKFVEERMNKNGTVYDRDFPTLLSFLKEKRTKEK